MLELKGVHAGYGPIPVLHDVNIQVNTGEIVCLIGANGAGKTTTLMSICGLVPPRQGVIQLDGQAIHGLPTNKIVELGVVQVPEGRLIFPELTVAENLDMGAFLRSDRPGIHEDIEYVFELFPILAERRRQAGGTLSGGEQQMLAISRAIMAKPKVLLLDEPSLGLAPLVIRRIFDIILKINRENGTTIFLVEQNAHQALKIAHRGYVMENGVITSMDTAANLLDNEEVRKAYLGI